MYGLVKKDDGSYYVSAIFGYWYDIENPYKHETSYYIVFNENKEKLIKLPHIKKLSGLKYKSQLFLVDSDKQDWIMDGKIGFINFLSKELADEITESGITPKDIYTKCIEIDNAYQFNPYREVHTEKDINDLMCVAGGFHDGIIVEQKMIDDTLYLLFDYLWDCKIEMWLSGNVECSENSWDSIDDQFSYWFDSSLVAKDGYFYFVNDCDATPENYKNYDLWFKAKNIKYHIITTFEI